VIGAAGLFWIVTEWPNSANAITFAAVGVLLFAPQADRAYATAMGFMVGTGLGAALAAIITFAVLPNKETFAAFGIAIGLILVPAGAGMVQPWQRATFTGMALNFVTVLSPLNQMSYGRGAQTCQDGPRTRPLGDRCDDRSFKGFDLGP
jgi:uncharacterized membrane protein YccC